MIQIQTYDFIAAPEDYDFRSVLSIWHLLREFGQNSKYSKANQKSVDHNIHNITFTTVFSQY